MNVVAALEAALPWSPVDVPHDVPTGDMPGDKVHIGPEHVARANALFPLLVGELVPVLRASACARAVVSVAGGSGVGKSEVASLVSHLLRTVGVGAYTLSGDNYPRRIPVQNDAERLRIFRDAGVRGLLAAGQYDADRAAVLRLLQEAETDADPAHAEHTPWLATYQEAGRAALRGYLGTPAEIDFAHLSQILGEFRAGAPDLHLRRMGRGPADLWYERVDMTDVAVLVVEWTHGNSEHLVGVDVPILLHSTPEQTLAHRLARARDKGPDSPFTTMVLQIEQDLLRARASHARIILTPEGERLSFVRYLELEGGAS
jgi:hypothetical protein